MLTLQWPTSLGLWKREIARAVNELKSQSSLNAHVSFSALNPRGKSSDRHHIDLGAQIILGSPSLVTYFFAIGEKDSSQRRKMLRKVHFDLNDAVYSEEPKPTFHLQLAGGASPPLLASGYENAAFDHLLPRLEKPRIPCLPQSFALLVHLAFLEYHSTDEALAAFMKSRGWLSVVTDAEATVLGPYFKHANTWLISTANQKRSLFSHFYGLAG